MDYDDILNRSWDEIPEPQILPAGDWLVAGANAALVKPTEEGKSLKVLLSYTAKSPVAVDEDKLAELGEYDISTSDLNYTIFVEKASDWDKVRKHLAIAGVPMEGAILNENGKLGFAKAFRGSEVVVELGERSFQNQAGETIWQNSMSKFRTVTE